MPDIVIRWGMSLLCVLVFCLTLVLMVQSMDTVAVQKEYVQRLKKRKRDLQSWKQAHIRLQEQLQEWNDLWRQVQDSTLDPALWREYPVNVRDTFLPDQAGHILQLLSTDINVGQVFWFAPRDIRAQPTVIQESPNGGQNGDEEPVKKRAVTLRIRGTILNTIDQVQDNGF